jgi:hypothetical protein
MGISCEYGRNFTVWRLDAQEVFMYSCTINYTLTKREIAMTETIARYTTANNALLENLRGIDPSRFVKVDWSLIHSLDVHEDCTGELACIFDDSYGSFEEAAESGAVYFASQTICGRAELEGALLGAEVSQKASGMRCTLYFVSRS